MSRQLAELPAGRARAARPTTPRTFVVAALEHLLDHLQAQRVVVDGHDAQAGREALTIARAAGHRLRRLVLDGLLLHRARAQRVEPASVQKRRNLERVAALGPIHSGLHARASLSCAAACAALRERGALARENARTQRGTRHLGPRSTAPRGVQRCWSRRRPGFEPGWSIIERRAGAPRARRRWGRSATIVARLERRGSVVVQRAATTSALPCRWCRLSMVGECGRGRAR